MSQSLHCKANRTSLSCFSPLPATAQAPGTSSSHLLRKSVETWVCLPSELNQSNTTTGQILTTHHWQTEQTLAQPAATSVLLDPLSSAWPRLHGPGCMCGLHMLSGSHDGPKTVSWPQGESAHAHAHSPRAPSHPKSRQMDPVP